MTVHPRLSVVRTALGKLRLDIDGEPVAGVASIDVVDTAGEKRAEIIVTFLGPFINFETEHPTNGES